MISLLLNVMAPQNSATSYRKATYFVLLSFGSFLACHTPEPIENDEKSQRVQTELDLLKQIESNPRQAAELCGKLQNEVARKRCNAIKMRPHLWYKQSAQKADKRRSSGPSARYLAPVVNQPPTPKPTNTICENGWTENACREAEAVSAKTIKEAMGTCANLKDRKWQEECYFVAAEKRLIKFGTERYGESVDLCLLAKTYTANCFNHLAKVISEKTNSAISNSARSWADVIWSTKQIERYWVNKDPLFGEATVDLIWAHATDIAYENAGIVAGNPLDFLPPEAKPHIRAAAAYHLMRLERADLYNLADWVKRIKRALNSRLKPSEGQPRVPFKRKAIATDWASDRLGDDAIPAVNYMTDGRRATSKDIDTDLAICVLEAAARLPNGQPLLLNNRQDTRELVSWTANRLLGEKRTSAPVQRPK